MLSTFSWHAQLCSNVGSEHEYLVDEKYHDAMPRSFSCGELIREMEHVR